MKKNRNFTLYWMVILGGILTVPIAFVIMKKFSDSSAFIKALLITAVFVIITGAIALLYRKVFGVSMEEISQGTKVSELDKKMYWLQSYLRKHQVSSNNMQKLFINIHKVMEQIETFERRKEVFIGLLDSEQREKGDALGELVHTVEDALVLNVDRIINRISIFDDKVQISIVIQNLDYIEQHAAKNNEILIDFEKLIAEVSSLGESQEEVDISKLTDILHAMESLRIDKDDEIDHLKKKYE